MQDDEMKDDLGDEFDDNMPKKSKRNDDPLNEMEEDGFDEEDDIDDISEEDDEEEIEGE